jgi:type II secretory pathway pseudopilin PulG
MKDLNTATNRVGAIDRNRPGGSGEPPLPSPPSQILSGSRPESVRRCARLWTINYQPSTIGCSHGSVYHAVAARRRVSRRSRLLPPMSMFSTIGGPVRRSLGEGGFSLLEVVIALGVITVGIVGVLAVFPTALQTGHSAQDETRAAHIAQSVFGSLVAGASSQFSNVQLPLSPPPSPSPAPTPFLSIDLTACSSPTAPTLYADNDGRLIQGATTATYAIFVFTCNSGCTPPCSFADPGAASEVTLRVLWPPMPNQGPTPAANQTFRDYVRIISKY